MSHDNTVTAAAKHLRIGRGNLANNLVAASPGDEQQQFATHFDHVT